MLKFSLGILFIVTLFEPTIQQYCDAYCTKYIATFPLTMEACNETYPNNNCSGSGLFSLTYSPDVCKNNMIISPIIPSIPSKKVNWNEYIVLSGSNFASEQNKNIVKSVKINEEIIKNIKSSQLALSELLIGFSAFLFTMTFFISLAQ